MWPLPCLNRTGTGSAHADNWAASRQTEANRRAPAEVNPVFTQNARKVLTPTQMRVWGESEFPAIIANGWFRSVLSVGTAASRLRVYS